MCSSHSASFISDSPSHSTSFAAGEAAEIKPGKVNEGALAKRSRILLVDDDTLLTLSNCSKCSTRDMSSTFRCTSSVLIWTSWW